MFPTIALPKLVTNEALAALASPNETHEVHVIVRRIVNHAPYTLRGRRRQYIVSRDPVRNAHILKVPISVWMAGCTDGTVNENDSIAYDIQSSRTSLKAPLTFEVWPIGEVQAKEAPAISGWTYTDGTGRTMKADGTTLDIDGVQVAPEALLDLVNGDGSHNYRFTRNGDEVLVDMSKPEPPSDDAGKPKPQTNAERQRAYRERKKQEAAAKS